MKKKTTKVMTSQRIEEQLMCPRCHNEYRLNIAKALPCKDTYCSNCLDGLNVSGRVKCPNCDVVHRVPANGFPINKDVQGVLLSIEMPNIPTINEPTHESGPNLRLQPTAPPLTPPSRPLQPIPEPPLLNHQADQHDPLRQPQQSQSHNPPINHPSSQKAPFRRGQAQNTSVSPSQPLASIQTQGRRSKQPPTADCQKVRTKKKRRKIGNTSEGGNNFDPCKTTFLKYFKITRTGVKKLISSFLRKYTNFMAVTTIIFLVITFSRFVAGAAKLSSDCPEERRVAQYLFVKSCLGFIFWGMLVLVGCKKQLMKTMDIPLVEVCVVTESLFSFIWLVIGTVWIGFRDEMIDECPFYVEEWNKHFINFAVFLTAVDWIGIVAFGFYCCYVHSDISNDDDTT